MWHLELGLELLDEADAGAGVGRDVDARQAQLAGVLGGGEEELVLQKQRLNTTQGDARIDTRTVKAEIKEKGNRAKIETWGGGIFGRVARETG